jgi:hypothetical protein
MAQSGTTARGFDSKEALKNTLIFNRNKILDSVTLLG